MTLLGRMLFWARRSTDFKRAVIKKSFELEAHEIRKTYPYPIDPRIWKLTLTGWSLSFVMAGVLLAPNVGFGDNIWGQFLVILAMELGFLLMGLVVIREFRIENCYLECYIYDFQFYKKAFALIIIAIVSGNAALIIPSIPWGVVAQAFAVGIMAVALYFIVLPIREEEKYYTRCTASKK